MFTPLVHTPKTLPKNTPQEVKTDFEILTADRAAYQALITAILTNKRLAWEIVAAWLDANNKLLVEGPSKNETLFMELWPQLDDREQAAICAASKAMGGD